MSNKEKKDNEPLVMDRFLLETLLSLRETISSIEKDALEKTDLIDDTLDNLKEIRSYLEKLDNKLDDNKSSVHELQDWVRAMQTQITTLYESVDLRNENITTHVKEIKYSIQSMTDRKVIRRNDPKPKFDLYKFVFGVWEFVKNLKVIAVTILLILAILASFIFGPDVLGFILDNLKK